jgi:hypothetical protein
MRVRRATLAIVTIASVGCGGGNPLLHPAHALPAGDVRGQAGMSGRGVLGDPTAAIRAAVDQSATGQVPGPGESGAYAQAAMALSALAPGIAPYVGARVGIGAHWEAGVASTGRGARIDLRKSFEKGPWAFSAGAALDGVFAGGTTSTALAGVDVGSLRGFGFDAPLIAGWRSTAGFYQVWFGARGGYQRYFIGAVTSEPLPGKPAPTGLEADRAHAGGVLGFATGFRRVHVALELEAGFEYLMGSWNSTSAQLTGASLTPATALWWDF